MSTAPNMNANVVYTISNPPSTGKPVESYPYYGEFFEVETPPISYKYSEVRAFVRACLCD